MKLSDELAADRQSQSASLDDRVLVARQAEERLEDSVERLRRECQVLSPRRSPTRNRPPTFPVTRTRPPDRRVLHGVRDEIAEDLLAA